MAAGAVSNAVTAVGSVAGGVAQAAGSAVGQVAGGVAQAAGAVATDDETQGLMAYVNDTLLRPTFDGAQDAATTPTATPTDPANRPADLARQTGVVLGNVLRTGEIDDADRAFLVAATAEQTGLTETEVEERVEAAITRVQDVRAQAEQVAADAAQAAADAAETARKAGILTAFLLTASALVAGAAAVAGAVRGGRHRDEGMIFGGFGYRIR